MLYDISPPISPALDVWPTDVPLTREVQADMHAGDGVTLSSIRATVHLGAHADAPSHYDPTGISIEQCDLENYLGLCQVIRTNVPRRTAITPSMLGEPLRAPRVLLATGTYSDPTAFNDDFAALSVELLDHLHTGSVRLIGIDTPSVDLFTDTNLPVHRQAAQHNILLLEGLSLQNVPAGIYELIALPLRLVGFDASPVRAVLRAQDSA